MYTYYAAHTNESHGVVQIEWCHTNEGVTAHGLFLVHRDHVVSIHYKKTM